MSGSEARSSASLLDMSNLRFEDGSSLPVAGNLRGITKLQNVSAVFDLHNLLLLRLFRSICCLGLEGNIERGRVYRLVDANQLCDVGSHFGHNWTRVSRLHGLAHHSCVERPNHDRMS